MAKRTRERIIPFFLPHEGCKERCSYCDQSQVAPGFERLPEREALWRTLMHGLAVCPDNLGRAEFAFYGGTFSGLPWARQTHLLSALAPFVRGGALAGIRFSTRPDELAESWLVPYRENGVKTIELGVQSFDETVLARCGRHYTSARVTEVCALLRQYGFRLGLHLMAGLPGQSRLSFSESAATAIDCRPEFVRIHPLLVFSGSPLAEDFRAGRYQPLTTDAARRWLKKPLADFKRAGIQLARLGLYLSPQMKKNVLAGPAAIEGTHVWR